MFLPTRVVVDYSDALTKGVNSPEAVAAFEKYKDVEGFREFAVALRQCHAHAKGKRFSNEFPIRYVFGTSELGNAKAACDLFNITMIFKNLNEETLEVFLTRPDCLELKPEEFELLNKYGMIYQRTT